MRGGHKGQGKVCMEGKGGHRDQGEVRTEGEEKAQGVRERYACRAKEGEGTYGSQGRERKHIYETHGR